MGGASTEGNAANMSFCIVLGHLIRDDMSI